MATGIRLHLEVEMENEEKLEVRADQRDVAAYEQSEEYTQNGVHARIRFMAWNALRRTGKMKLTFSKFNDECVDAWLVEDVEEEVDPTQTDQPFES